MPGTVTRRPGKRTARAAEQKLLKAGSAEHYDDPSYYARTYAKRSEDVGYYLAQAQALLPRGGRILELACGNGRIGLELARAGFSLVGVDLSRPMLDDFRRQLRLASPELRGRVRLLRGDMRDARLAPRIAPRFDLVICPFNAVLHLYTREDIEDFFSTVRACLKPGGHLLFDLYHPEPSELLRTPEKPHGTPPFRYPLADGSHIVVKYRERFDYNPASQVLFVSMEFHPTKADTRAKARWGPEGWVQLLTHRQFFPAELEALLHYNGFEILHADANFTRGQRYDKDSQTCAYLCRRIPKRSRAKSE